MTQTARPPKLRPRLSPDDRLAHIPYKFRHTSAGLGWSGLRVEDAPESKRETSFIQPPLECVFLILHGDALTKRADHRCDEARYVGDGLPHAVTLVPSGVECQWGWRDAGDATVYQLLPALVAKVAEEAFDLDPARVRFPVRYFDQSFPAVLNTLTSLRNELVAGGPGGRLCAESLANVLLVQLIRQVASGPATKEFARKPGGRLPRPALRAVEEYIDAHLDQNFALADLAAVAHLSEFHFARLFKQTTGLPPHQFVIHQRVERAKRLITARQLSLAQVAVEVGFSDQSQLNRHFKRLVGVTPSRFA